MKLLAQYWRKIFRIDVAAAHLVDDLQHDAAAVIDESVPVPSQMLLALEVYPILETWCKPGTDGLSLVIPTVHNL